MIRRAALALALLLPLWLARPVAAVEAEGWTVYGAHVSHYDEGGVTYSGVWTVAYWTASCGPDYLGAYITLWDGSVWHCEDRGGAVRDGMFDLFAPGDYSIDARYNGTDVEVDW